MDNEALDEPEVRGRPAKPFNQACQLQRVAYDLVMDSETKPSDCAQLIRAWEVLEERKRILRMRPKPKDIEMPMPAMRQRRLSSRSALNVIASLAASDSEAAAEQP
jgi:hypothetical protein